MTFWQRFASVLLVVGLLIVSQPLIHGAMFLGDVLTGAINYSQGIAQQTPSLNHGNDGVSVNIGPVSDQEEEFDLSVRFKSDDAQLRFKGDEDGGSLSLQADGQV